MCVHKFMEIVKEYLLHAIVSLQGGFIDKIVDPHLWPSYASRHCNVNFRTMWPIYIFPTASAKC